MASNCHSDSWPAKELRLSCRALSPDECARIRVVALRLAAFFEPFDHQPYRHSYLNRKHWHGHRRDVAIARKQQMCRLIFTLTKERHGELQQAWPQTQSVDKRSRLINAVGCRTQSIDKGSWSTNAVNRRDALDRALRLQRQEFPLLESPFNLADIGEVLQRIVVQY